MAITNHERVGKALELLRDGLRPFVERELEAKHGKYWLTTVTSGWSRDVDWNANDEPHLDAAALLLRMMWEQWNDVFRRTLGHAERSLVSELRDVRNNWAHQNAFSSDDAYRALDSAAPPAHRRLRAAGDEVEKMKMELLRLRFDEQVRSEKRKSAGTRHRERGHRQPQALARGGHAAQGRGQRPLPAGRVRRRPLAGASGRRHATSTGTRSSSSAAPTSPRASSACSSARVQRLAGKGGDPVVQLQTNFGGGKTHSMLALYHLFSGIVPERAGGHRCRAARGRGDEPAQPRAAWCWWATRSRPAIPSPSPTAPWCARCGASWPGSSAARRPSRASRPTTRSATSPGDVLRELFNEYGPCLILIDEWVAYARQLHDQSDLPAGGFETQFTFAQALTESAKLAKNCLLVISLPASDTAGSPHTQADDVEVGGERGREALDRLRNVVGRVESSWRPASAEEGFEIVRRRLFEPLPDPAQFKDRDVVARAFADLYRTQQPGVPARMPRRRLREAHQGRLSRSTPRSSTGSTPTGPRW